MPTAVSFGVSVCRLSLHSPRKYFEGTNLLFLSEMRKKNQAPWKFSVLVEDTYSKCQNQGLSALCLPIFRGWVIFELLKLHAKFGVHILIFIEGSLDSQMGKCCWCMLPSAMTWMYKESCCVTINMILDIISNYNKIANTF